MLISLDILKKFVDLEGVKPQEIADKLTEHSFEVDDVVSSASAFNNIIVGKIEKVEAHPSADKLRVCDVLISKTGGLFNKKEEVVKIVCGGSNLEKGMFVIVALPGSFVKWHGEGDLVEIKETELRGVASYGMICASDEIGLSDIFPSKSEKEIVELSLFKDKIKGDLKVGENIADLLGYNDVAFDVDNTAVTHRPDLWGHYGIARELSVIYKRELRPIEFDALSGSIFTQLKIDVQDFTLCKNYNAVKINNIKIEESPEWLKNAVVSTGHKSINNIVDLANYVMLELGQPLHTFDSSKVSNKIFVRNAKTGERIKTLDNKEVDLDESILIISDSIRPIAIAGVIGGLDSAISNSTNSIVLEAANFDGIGIRKTMQKIGTRTDAGARYEKQIDPEFANIALARFIALLKTVLPKITIENVLNLSKYDNSKKHISLSFDFIKSRIGVDLSVSEITNILGRLGFETKIENDEILVVYVPYFRNKDVNIKEDLIEEIARIHGYNNIAEAVLVPTNLDTRENLLRKFERKTKDFMISNGFSEVLNYCFISGEEQKEFGFNDNEVVKLMNSLSADQDRMRPTLAINLIKNVKENLKNTKDFKLFEIERIFRNDIESKKYENLPFQNYYFGGVVTEEDNMIPLYSLKNYLEKIFNLFKVSFEYVVIENNIPIYCHPARFAKIAINGEVVGYISELNPKLALKNKINQKVSFFEIDFEKFYDLIEEKISYKSIPKFQTSSSDISMIVDKNVLWQEVKKEVLAVSSLIESVELFDVFNGENIGNDKVSLAFRMSFVDREKTMVQADIDELYNKVSELLISKFKAEIRK